MRPGEGFRNRFHRRKDKAEPSGQFRGKGTHTHGKDKAFN